MVLRSIPQDAPIRVVGDVHGDAVAFGYAAATDRFVVQLGDLTDYGPDNAGVLRIMFRLIDEGRGLFLLGNHDLKLARLLAGQPVRNEATLDATLAQLDDRSARARGGRGGRRAGLAAAQWRAVRARRLPHRDAGDPTRRSMAWIARTARWPARCSASRPGAPSPTAIPSAACAGWIAFRPGITVYCGHDRRSTDGRPYIRRGAAGGSAVFLDTGAGKGGHLSWIDL